MIRPGLLRCKYICAEYGRIVVAALVIVSVISLGASVWVYQDAETEQVTEEAYHQSVETRADTRTVVTGETPLWEEGTVLENRPFYPTDEAPNMTIRVTTTVPSGQPVQLYHRVALVYRVKRGDATIWQSEDSLDDQHVQVSDGEAVTTTTVSIPSVLNKMRTLSDALSGVGDVDVMVKLNASYQTNRYSGRLSATTPLTVRSSGYWLKGELRDEHTHSTTVTRKHTKRNEPLSAALALIGLFGAAAAFASARYYSDGPDSREIKRQIDQERCFEWISEGRISQPIKERDIEMRTLEDLVDVAIDSKHRVVYDPERDIYAVVELDLLYYYDPSPSQTEVQPSQVGASRGHESGVIRAERRSSPADETDTTPPAGVQTNGDAVAGKANGHTRETPDPVDAAFVRKRWSGLMDGNGDAEIAVVSVDETEPAESPVADGGHDADSELDFEHDRWAELIESLE